MGKSDFIKNAEENFLTYAGAVIKSRAISDVEDNLKPVTRRILWAMYEGKMLPNKPTVKCAKVTGSVIASYHPHGDASVYDALIHLGQPWKMRYPLVYVQGNVGNILGDGPAASRYTECRLSKVGELMLRDLEKRPVDFRPNYDDTTEEPVLLPSIFPNTLCNGSLGIAVGLSASLVPHNINEVVAGITACIDNPEITVAELMKYIPGPDFPEGALIVDGEKLGGIYTSGRGSVTCRAHYRLGKTNGRDEIVFTDLPYQVEIESGVIVPLKKLVNEENCDLFYDYQDNTDDKHVEFHVVLNKGVNPDIALALLYSKTKLEQTVKINNTVLVQGEPRQLGLIEMIREYLRHRNNCLIRVARTDLEKVKHKLTIVIGLQKCMSNIDRVIALIRGADNRAAAKAGLMKEFELNEEQADAVLDMKLSRLSRLDIADLETQQKDLENEIVNQNDIIANQERRNSIIKAQLAEMAKLCGDKRRTEIRSEAVEDEHAAPIREFFVYSDRLSDILPPTSGALQCVLSNSAKKLFTYAADGSLGTEAKIGVGRNDREFLITVTKDGYVKKTAAADVNFDRAGKLLKVREGDELLMADTADSSDFVLLLGKSGKLLKLAVDELNTASKMTQGLATALDGIVAAVVASANDSILFVDKDGKGKLVATGDFTVGSRTSKGQTINEGNKFMLNVTGRDTVYYLSKGKIASIDLAKKVSMKSKTAGGAALTAKAIEKII